ncbi:MAG: ABC transporter permease [Candidatus Schekmanbacteria bacterium]|nr:ABC transporter permease [Candidatus Schekmanbacteria bacterium]
MYFSDRAFKTGAVGLLISLFLYFIILLVCGAATVGLQRFTAILFSEKILFAIKLSIFTATVSTILSMLVAVPASFALSRFQFRGKGIIDMLLDVPIILSPIAIGAMLLIFFNTNAGKTVEKFTIPFVFEVPGIILAQFTVVCALAVRLLKSTFDSIDTRYEKVSRTLGLSSSASFFKVVVPLAKNGLIASAILTWARAIGEFGATVTLAGAMPMKTETLPVAIYLSFANADIERAMAVVFILVAMALSVLLLIRKLTAEKIS